MLYVLLRMAFVKKMCKIILVHTMKACRAGVDIAACMSNLGTRWK